MGLSWRAFFKVVNDAGKVYEGRSRYLRFFKGIREIERLYRSSGEGDELSAAHLQGAHLIISLCRQNGAMWVKVAQYLSCRPDLLPREYIQVLSELQTASNHGSASSFTAVHQVLTESWGEGWEKHFLSFDLVPVAIGSIAQVYRATLLNGAIVAIKVRVPGVEVLYEQDAIVLKAIAKCLEPFYKEFNFVSIIDELIGSTEAELDFSYEQNNIAEYCSLQKRWPLPCPEVELELSNSVVLVTSWVDGQPLQSLLKQSGVDLTIENAVEIITLSILEDIFIHGFYHGDPHPGNIMVGDSIELIDFGLVGRVSASQRGHYLLLLGAMMHSNGTMPYETLFQNAGFAAKDPAIFGEVGQYIQSVQENSSLCMKMKLQKILDELRQNQIVLPQGFVGIIRVILLLSGIFQQTKLDFEAVFLKMYVKNG